jgi:hypothetical protein
MGNLGREIGEPIFGHGRQKGAFAGYALKWLSGSLQWKMLAGTGFDGFDLEVEEPFFGQLDLHFP